MFERAPFRPCPACGNSQLGLLSAGGLSLTRRCRVCRYSETSPLPPLNKKVIYLDQFAVSEIYKLRSNIRKAKANSQAFWKELERVIRRVSLLQQAVFPESEIHSNETIVSPFPTELRVAHEMLGGDISFVSPDKIVFSQNWDFFLAFIENRSPPHINFSVDKILIGDRNTWIADLHISVNMNYSQFAEGIRTARDNTAGAISQVAERWAREKPTFQQVLQDELNSFGRSHVESVLGAMSRIHNGHIKGDVMDVIEGTHHRVYRQFTCMADHLQSAGYDEESSTKKIIEFWHSPQNIHIPHHRISSYLFAAAARKMASGQKRCPSRGFVNDVSALSIYGPYVDAIFIDNECAGLLQESPLREELGLDDKIFCMNRGDDFISYLRSLEAAADPLVHSYAEEIYGLS